LLPHYFYDARVNLWSVVEDTILPRGIEPLQNFAAGYHITEFCDEPTYLNLGAVLGEKGTDRNVME
jgi:hypothetical protein